jgi:midasin
MEVGATASALHTAVAQLKKALANISGSRVAEQQEEQLQSGLAVFDAAAAAARAPFMWVDGPLVVAMRGGDMLLVDEINLAEAAVLERLNR